MKRCLDTFLNIGAYLLIRQTLYITYFLLCVIKTLYPFVPVTQVYIFIQSGEVRSTGTWGLLRRMSRSTCRVRTGGLEAVHLRSDHSWWNWKWAGSNRRFPLLCLFTSASLFSKYRVPQPLRHVSGVTSKFQEFVPHSSAFTSANNAALQEKRDAQCCTFNPKCLWQHDNVNIMHSL